MPSLDSKYAIYISSLSSFGGGFSLTVEEFFFFVSRTELFVVVDRLDTLADGEASVVLGAATGTMSCTTEWEGTTFGTTAVLDPCDFSFLR